MLSALWRLLISLEENFEIATPLTAASVVAAIQRNLSDDSRWFGRKPKRFFVGAVSKSSFKLKPAPDWGRGVYPIIEGKLLAVEDGTRINVRLHAGPFGAIWFSFFWIWMFIVIVGASSLAAGRSIQTLSDLLTSGIVVIVVLYVFLGARGHFRSEARVSRATLMQIIEAAQTHEREHEGTP